MIGWPRVHHRVIDSTNERAKRLAAGGAKHGTLVTADEQTAGRGRQGRTWRAPPGSALLMSLVLRRLFPHHAVLPLTAAVAVCEACESLAPVECRIKWPNDVWVGDRKLAGVLVEGRPQERWAVVGIGLNVTSTRLDLPWDLRGTATSLRAEVGEGGPGPEPVLRALLERLDDRLDDDPDDVLDAWRARDALRGRRVRWAGGEGSATGIDRAGALLVDTDAGRVKLDAGEVHLL